MTYERVGIWDLGIYILIFMPLNYLEINNNLSQFRNSYVISDLISTYVHSVQYRQIKYVMQMPWENSHPPL